MKTYIVKINDIGNKEWYLNGKLHREDGPAIEWADGSKYWYSNDKRHREDGPAIEWVDGTKFWYLNDKLHREDGPAIEYYSGEKYWHLSGVSYTEAQWSKQIQKKVKATCVGKIVEIDGVKYKLVEA
jgi:hypothetical protein